MKLWYGKYDRMFCIFQDRFRGLSEKDSSYAFVLYNLVGIIFITNIEYAATKLIEILHIVCDSMLVQRAECV